MQKPRLRKPDLCSLGKSVVILPGMCSYIANVPNRNRLWASKQFIIILLSNVNSLFHIKVMFNSKNMLPDVLLTLPHQQILQDGRGWLDISSSKGPYELSSVWRSIWIVLCTPRTFSRFQIPEIKTANIMCKPTIFVYKRIR